MAGSVTGCVVGWFQELSNGVLALEGHFYFGMFEKVCGFFFFF
jgi:hypothetical protein